GTVAALWLYDNFVGWLSVLNATLPPVGAIIVADFFMRKSAYKEEADKDLKKVNWFALAGVVAGALVGNFVTWGIAAINAMVVAVVIYAIGHFVQKNNRAAA
ncbi:MAG TPA: cytosine permease, partial [Oscillospiraceae bacterium]|nr:cytosine permease [Oscillospiraceae bacterium]